MVGPFELKLALVSAAGFEDPLLFIAPTVITKGSLLLLIAAVAHGQGNPPVGSKWKEYISLSDYLIPFWRADTVFDETVQLIKDNGKAEGTLLFKARKILSVKSADQLKSFVRKKDWHKFGKLRAKPTFV